MGRIIKLIIYYFAYQCAVMILGLVGYILIEYAKTGNISFDKGTPITLALIIGLIATLLMGWHLIHFNYIKIDRKSLSPISGKVACIYILMGISAIAWMNWLNDFIHLPDWNENLFLQMKDNIFGIITACIAAPIFEELFFRGAIEGHLLRRWKNPTYAILVSALIFGVIHGNPAQSVFAFFFGLILGDLYYRTGSLMPGMILHFINNTLSFILMRMYPDNNSLTEIIGEHSAQIMAIIGIGLFCLLMNRFRKEVKPVSWYEPEAEVTKEIKE